MAEGGGHRPQGSRRPRQQTRRYHRVEFTLTEQEFAALEDAAKRTELARGAYAANGWFRRAFKAVKASDLFGE